MGNPAEFDARLAKADADALAARHLAAAHDRDIADLGVKVDANRRAINALAVQTAERFDRVDRRMDRIEAEMHSGFTEMRAGFAMTAAGMQHIVDLITPLIPEQDRPDRS